jgi:hypothetical protein
VSEKSEAKKEAEELKAVEAHVEPDNTEIPDHTAQRKVEAHRQAQVGQSVALDTGDTSAVDPQPDRDAPGVQHSYAPIVEGERQVTEQPDRYAVSGDSSGAAVEPNAKNKRGARRKKDDSDGPESAESAGWPAQFEGDGKEQYPAQYSW